MDGWRVRIISLFRMKTEEVFTKTGIGLVARASSLARYGIGQR